MKKRLSPNRSVWMVLSLLCHSFLLKYHTNNDILIAIDFKYLMKWIWDSVKAFAQMRITICKWWLCVYFIWYLLMIFSINIPFGIWFIELWLLLPWKSYLMVLKRTWTSVEWCITLRQSTCLLICGFLYLFFSCGLTLFVICLFHLILYISLGWWERELLFFQLLLDTRWYQFNGDFIFISLFFQDKSDFSFSYHAKKQSQPLNNEWRRRQVSERTRKKNTLNRVHGIKANEIVRHNIIQLFDIFVGECKRTLNHISSEMPVSSVISWPRGKRISNTIPAFSHFASCHSHSLRCSLLFFLYRWLVHSVIAHQAYILLTMFT